MSLRGSIWASASKLNVTKKPNYIPKRAVYVSLSVIQCYPSSLGWTAGEIRKKKGMTEPTQNLINSRAALMVQISAVRPWPKALKRTAPWRSWIWSRTKSVLTGQRLGVWWGWHAKKGHRGRIKTEPLESEVSDMFTGSERNALDAPWFFTGCFVVVRLAGLAGISNFLWQISLQGC